MQHCRILTNRWLCHAHLKHRQAKMLLYVTRTHYSLIKAIHNLFFLQLRTELLDKITIRYLLYCRLNYSHFYICSDRKRSSNDYVQRPEKYPYIALLLHKIPSIRIKLTLPRILMLYFFNDTLLFCEYFFLFEIGEYFLKRDDFGKNLRIMKWSKDVVTCLNVCAKKNVAWNYRRSDCRTNLFLVLYLVGIKKPASLSSGATKQWES